ncbi:hypothetical protein [Desulfonatronum parangueonense]
MISALASVLLIEIAIEIEIVVDYFHHLRDFAKLDMMLDFDFDFDKDKLSICKDRETEYRKQVGRGLGDRGAKRG